jgi:hypothetical protein
MKDRPMNLSPNHEQLLANAIVERFIARCQHLWPGCRVEIRQTQQSYAIPAQRGSAPNGNSAFTQATKENS